ncbi:MAG: DUF4248 domain-containing protein [Bacteroidetes bacterium]|nr:DUF4248 domain-containing protein [Bacteroidota bacterium]
MRTKLQIQVIQRTLGSLDGEEFQAMKQLMTQLTHTLYGNTTKFELAQLYDMNWRTLNKRLKSTAGLMEELTNKYNYTKHRRFFLPAELEIIQKYLGIPPRKL